MSTPVAKTSGLAVTAFVLAILSIFTLSLTMIPAVIFGIAGLVKICNSRGKLKGNGFAVAGIAISIAPIILFGINLIIFTFIWSLDAPPIPDDYTIADLRSAPTECARSYELLMSISEKEKHPTGAPAIGLSAQDVNTIEQVNGVIKESDYSKIANALKEKADDIEQAWKNGQKGRDIISELNTFPEIADLTESNLDAEIGFLPNLRRLARLYEAYVYLQTEQGNDKVAINELIKLDSVFRKLSVNARSIVTKMVCISGLYTGIRAANFIINNPKTPQESLDLLAEHFTPLTNEQIALRSSFISDYLMAKNTLEARLQQVVKRSPLLLKRNSTLRALRSVCDSAIYYAGEAKENEKHEWSIWPSFYPDSMPTARDLLDEPSCWRYKYYNPTGYWFICIMTPALGRIAELKMKIKVHDELLQIVLNKRLGNEVSLKARAYSDEYIIDIEKKKIFSPGPDGKADTKDDIKLTINPEVLNFTD